VVRVTPGNRIGTVDVRCAPVGGGTVARITYELTALSPDGEACIARFDETRYAEMLASWERDIARAQARERAGAPADARVEE
jgi:hypothetical protein